MAVIYSNSPTEGPDKLIGGNATDYLKGLGGGDTLVAGAGNDLLDGGPGNDRLDGGTGADALRGDTGADVLRGEDGADTLYGGAGADTLRGGAGADTLYGGADPDVFVFRSAGESGAGAGTRDVVADFAGGADKIDLGAIDADSRAAGDQAFSWGGRASVAKANAVTWFSEGGSTVVQVDANGDGKAEVEVELAGFTAGLSASDFIL
jgi:Ca2+-binding RTX toxin-like protein